jgi:hypothetical protein
MQIVHHSKDATQRREAERKGNEDKENYHPRDIDADRVPRGRRLLERGGCRDERASGCSGAERRGTVAEERREEREVSSWLL